jgi:hypothetical protein
LFPANWSFFIPKANNADLGDVLHVTGDVRSGFRHAIKRNYEHGITGRKHQLILVAEVDAMYVKDFEATSEFIGEAPIKSIDGLEEVILSVPAPGKSLRSASVCGSALFIVFLQTDTIYRIRQHQIPQLSNTTASSGSSNAYGNSSVWASFRLVLWRELLQLPLTRADPFLRMTF